MLTVLLSHICLSLYRKTPVYPLCFLRVVTGYGKSGKPRNVTISISRRAELNMGRKK